jgi:hypothetical protein
LEDWWVCLVAKKIKKKWKEISGFSVSCCISLGAKSDGFCLRIGRLGCYYFLVHNDENQNILLHDVIVVAGNQKVKSCLSC